MPEIIAEPVGAAAEGEILMCRIGALSAAKRPRATAARRLAAG